MTARLRPARRFFLPACGLGRCSAGSAATRDSDGATSVADAHALPARPRAPCARRPRPATAALSGRITAAAEKRGDEDAAAMSGEHGGDRTVVMRPTGSA